MKGQIVQVAAGRVLLEGVLTIPAGATGLVLFAHGSGSSRRSPRNQFVAESLVKDGLATLLIDLLTAEEEEIDKRTRHLRFDIELLANRLVGAADWLGRQAETRELRIGLFGASTGAAAALIAATERPEVVHAVVSRGGRPDLADPVLPQVRAPVLLIVGGSDTPVIGMNEQALARLVAKKELRIIRGASHLFEEPGTLAEVAALAGQWFVCHLAPPTIDEAE